MERRINFLIKLKKIMENNKPQTGMQKVSQLMPSQLMLSGENSALLVSKIESLKYDLTPVIAISSGTAVSKLKKDCIDTLEDTVTIYLTKLVQRQKTSEKMDEFEIVDCVQMLLRKYYYFTLEEFVLILNDSITAKTYNRLDTSVVCNWFEDYDKERISHFKKAEQIKNQKTAEEKELERKAILQSYSNIAHGAEPFLKKIDRLKREQKEAQIQRQNEYRIWMLEHFNDNK